MKMVYDLQLIIFSSFLSNQVQLMYHLTKSSRKEPKLKLFDAILYKKYSTH